MMTADGTMFMSHTKPLVTRAADGTFALTLLVFDKIDPRHHQVEAWHITYSGPDAEAFWQDNASQLVAGQPIHVNANKLRIMTAATRNGGPEVVANVVLMYLAPTAQQAQQACDAAVIY
jgi:hypothetical protein